MIPRQPHRPTTIGMQNPSCLLYGPGDARFEDQPMPQIEDPYDVIIRIAYVGVCGSDVGNPSQPMYTLSHLLNPMS